jgi:hypothetical protein
LKNMGWSDTQEVAFKGALANLDLNQLPDELIECIAQGEHILSVLASAAERGLTRDERLRLPPAEEEEREEGAAEWVRGTGGRWGAWGLEVASLDPELRPFLPSH